MSKREVVLVSAVRTGVGDFGGALEGHPAVRSRGAGDQGIAGAGARSNRPRVGHVFFGHVINTEPRDLYLSRVGALERRPAAGSGRGQRQPAVRQRPAGDRLGGAVDPAGRHRRRHRRRRRIDESRPLQPAQQSLGCPHGRCQGGRHAGRRLVGSVRCGPHGHHRRECRGALRDQPRRPRTSWLRRATCVPRAPGRKGASPRRSCRSRRRSSARP